MPGFFGYYDPLCSDLNSASVLNTIDPAGLCTTRTFCNACGKSAVSWLEHSPIPTGKYFEDEDITACFAGDLVGFTEIPWKFIIEIVRKGDFGQLADFRGAFALSVYEKKRGNIYLISDRISMQPLYYSIVGPTFIFSTALPFFCRSPRDFAFNDKWLWELLFFNYPVGETTFIRNVLRMPPASVVAFNLETSRLEITKYAEPFRRTDRLRKGTDAIAEAVSVFEKRVPEYFDSTERTAVSITGGFDSRTVLSFAPLERITTYTYGIRGSGDLEDGSKIASEAGLNHHSIEFDEDFLAELPGLIDSTIHLSGGMERVVRATLPYVYRTLTADGTRFPVIVTGVSGDHLFRDHIKGSGNVPSIISADMMAGFHTGDPSLDKDYCRRIFSGRYTDFVAYILDIIEQLKGRYGDLQTPEAYLSYLIYEVAPHYFAGEAEIAKNFGTFRSPFWDADIIQLSYDIEYSTLGFSKSLPFKDKYRECVLQASIMQNNKRLSHIPINGIPLRFYSADNKLYYNLGRTILRAPGKIKSILSKPAYTAPEDWKRWFKIVLEERINNLITKESFITEYLDWKFIEGIKRSKDTHWLGKMLTAELVLRLFNRGWKMSE